MPFMLRSYGDWQALLDDETVHLDSQAAHAFFCERAEESGFQVVRRPGKHKARPIAVWHEMKGAPERILPIIGPLSDLIVVSRARTRKSMRARSFILSSLMLTGRPVLLLAQRRVVRIGQRILIAWNQSPEAAAAVRAALPLLSRAESVTIVTCGAEDRPGPKATQLQQYLQFHDVQATRMRTKGRQVDEELADAFAQTDADLLVMGAYSRSRWRETVFGGVTSAVLEKSSLPTLMLHR